MQNIPCGKEKCHIQTDNIRHLFFSHWNITLLQYLLSLSVSGMDIKIQPIYYKYGHGYTSPHSENKVICDFCDVIVSKNVLYRHRIVCAGLPADKRAESSAIATRYSSQRAIRAKLSKYVYEKYGGKRIPQIQWPVAFVKYIKNQVRHLPKDTGHNVMDYYDMWRTRDIVKMKVLSNEEFYKMNKDCDATG
jgi:hypothetical protein